LTLQKQMFHQVEAVVAEAEVLREAVVVVVEAVIAVDQENDMVVAMTGMVMLTILEADEVHRPAAGVEDTMEVMLTATGPPLPLHLLRTKAMDQVVVMASNKAMDEAVKPLEIMEKAQPMVDLMILMVHHQLFLHHQATAKGLHTINRVLKVMAVQAVMMDIQRVEEVGTEGVDMVEREVVGLVEVILIILTVVEDKVDLDVKKKPNFIFNLLLLFFLLLIFSSSVFDVLVVIQIKILSPCSRGPRCDQRVGKRRMRSQI